jgi:hypothetical protein
MILYCRAPPLILDERRQDPVAFSGLERRRMHPCSVVGFTGLRLILPRVIYLVGGHLQGFQTALQARLVHQVQGALVAVTVQVLARWILNGGANAVTFVAHQL